LRRDSRGAVVPAEREQSDSKQRDDSGAPVRRNEAAD